MLMLTKIAVPRGGESVLAEETCGLVSGSLLELEVDERLHFGADKLIDDENGQYADDTHDGKG